jgi:hypothetical protein
MNNITEELEHKLNIRIKFPYHNMVWGQINSEINRKLRVELFEKTTVQIVRPLCNQVKIVIYNI